MLQFKKVYADLDDLHVPKVYPGFTSERVLVMEFISGTKITEIETLKSWGLDPLKVAETGTNVYLTQIFERGFFHADPHPGNVLVQLNGKIAFVDNGQVEKLSRQQRYSFAGVIISIANKNAKSLAINLRRLSVDH